MNRLERVFERGVDRLLKGDWERRIGKLAWITLASILCSLAVLLWMAKIPIDLEGEDRTHKAPEALWRIMLDRQ